jgi:hypothetical protein
LNAAVSFNECVAADIRLHPNASQENEAVHQAIMKKIEHKWSVNPWQIFLRHYSIWRYMCICLGGRKQMTLDMLF